MKIDIWPSWVIGCDKPNRKKKKGTQKSEKIKEPKLRPREFTLRRGQGKLEAQGERGGVGC